MSNSTQAAIQTQDDQPLDMHRLYRAQSGCGYDNTLTLLPGDVQAIASRLRGITALSAVLMVAGDSERLKLGDWLHGGLCDAMHALAEDAGEVLERYNNRINEAKKARKQ